MRISDPKRGFQVREALYDSLNSNSPGDHIARTAAIESNETKDERITKEQLENGDRT